MGTKSWEYAKKSIKSLNRCYSLPLTDRHRWQDISKLMDYAPLINGTSWMSRVFANGPRDRSSIPGPVISKTPKWYLMPPCLTFSIIRYGSKVKWVNPVASSPTPWCCSYRKGSLLVTLDYGCQLYLLLEELYCELNYHDHKIIIQVNWPCNYHE